jgi:hypothetical protein
MRDVGFIEGSDYVKKSIDLADVSQELVPQSFSSTGAPDQSRDVDELNEAGGAFLGLENVVQLLQATIRHRNHADILIDGGEGVVGHIGVSTREAVKER